MSITAVRSFRSAELGISNVQIFDRAGEVREAVDALSRRLNFLKSVDSFHVKVRRRLLQFRRLAYNRLLQVELLQAGFGGMTTEDSSQAKMQPLRPNEGDSESAHLRQAAHCTQVTLLSCYDAEAPLFAAQRWRLSPAVAAEVTARIICLQSPS